MSTENAKQVVDVFASGLVHLKEFLEMEPDVFEKMKLCHLCFCTKAPCDVCQARMEQFNRPQKKLVFALMNPCDYDESIAGALVAGFIAAD